MKTYKKCDIIFHSFLPTVAKEFILNNANQYGYDATEVKVIDEKQYEFEFGYANNLNASLVVGRLPWQERMRVWVDIIEHDPSQLSTLRRILNNQWAGL